MRGRAVGLGLLGLGAFLLVGALMVGLVLAPTMVRLPLDQTATVVVADENATYLDMGELEEASGPVTATVRVEGDPSSADADADTAVWLSGTTITTEDGELVTPPSEQTTCLDRREAASVECDAASADITGLTVTFPFGTEARDYDVWNGNAGAAFPARYAGEETVAGVDVYRFEHSIPETVIDRAQVPGSLAGVPDEPSVTAEAVYSNERVLLVEPTSGKIVSVTENPVIVLRGPDGTTGATVLEADFAPTEESLTRNAEGAAETRDEITMIGTVLPWVLAGLGLMLVVAGAVLLARARRTATAAHRSQAPPVPVATH